MRRSFFFFFPFLFHFIFPRRKKEGQKRSSNQQAKTHWRGANKYLPSKASKAQPEGKSNSFSLTFFPFSSLFTRFFIPDTKFRQEKEKRLEFNPIPNDPKQEIPSISHDRNDRWHLTDSQSPTNLWNVPEVRPRFQDQNLRILRRGDCRRWPLRCRWFLPPWLRRRFYSQSESYYPKARSTHLSKFSKLSNSLDIEGASTIISPIDYR